MTSIVSENRGALDKTRSTTGMVFDIQRFAVHDGPGIRTLVFLKGCPLQCQWCANPESLNPQPEIGFIKANCDRCGKCPAVCSKQAIVLDKQGEPVVARELCDNCGECSRVCTTHALIVYGRERSAQEVFDEVKRDNVFYRSSGGGVTLSGGEPLRQASFVNALFAICREAGIHTALETCGYASTGQLQEVLKLTDHVLFDLKCMDEETHVRLTGRSNATILENARLVAGSGIDFRFRMPFIPGLNDKPDNLAATALFIKKLCIDKCEIELMPYHRMGIAKYDAVGKEYGIRHITPPTAADLQVAKSAFEKAGVTCLVSI